MTYEGFRWIFIGGGALAVVMLVVSVLLFFLLKIPAVIGDLTGANARKISRSAPAKSKKGNSTEGLNTGAEDAVGQTVELSQMAFPAEPGGNASVKDRTEHGEFTVEYEITFINTTEVIS